MKKIIALTVMAMMLLVAGCGGGGGGGESSTPTSAVLKLSATPGTLPAGKTVAGLAATIELPPGVIVKTAADGKAVDSTVVVPSGLLGGTGNAVMGPVSYTAATTTSKAKLDFTIASAAAAGVGEGEYVTITFILNGVSPAVTDFNVSSFELTCLPLYDILTVTASKVLTVQ